MSTTLVNLMQAIFPDEGISSRQTDDVVERGFFLNGVLHGINGYRLRLKDPFVVEEGDFQNGLLEGKGIRRHYSSDPADMKLISEEKGTFQNGLLHGSECTITYLKNNQTIHGEFREGKPWFTTEPGHFFDASSQAWFIGCFLFGKLVGQAIKVDIKGLRVDQGTFINDQLEGPGTVWHLRTDHPSNDEKLPIVVSNYFDEPLDLVLIFVGPMKKGLLEGNGCQVNYPNGRKLNGTFKGGEPVDAQGWYFYNSTWYYGRFLNNYLNGIGFILRGTERTDAYFKHDKPQGFVLTSNDQGSSLTFKPCNMIDAKYWIALWNIACENKLPFEVTTPQTPTWQSEEFDKEVVAFRNDADLMKYYLFNKAQLLGVSGDLDMFRHALKKATECPVVTKEPNINTHPRLVVDYYYERPL